MQVKRIGFVGAHNAGKDTLSHSSFAYLKKQSKTCYYIGEMAEQALMRNMALNVESGQLWLLGKQIAAEMQAQQFKREYVICNRTVLDGIAYAAEMISEGFSWALETMALAYMRRMPYKLIVYLSPLPSIEDDGVRMTDREQQLRIDARLKKITQNYCVQHNIDFAPVSDDNKPAREKTIESLLDIYVEKWRLENC